MYGQRMDSRYGLACRAPVRARESARRPVTALSPRSDDVVAVTVECVRLDLQCTECLRGDRRRRADSDDVRAPPGVELALIAALVVVVIATSALVAE